MKNAFSLLRAHGLKMSIAASSLLSSAVFAIDNDAIKAAQTAGTTSVQLTTTGMIQIVAVVVAVGLVISLLRKV